MKKTRILGLILAATMLLGTAALATEPEADVPDSVNENPDGDKVICPIEQTEGEYVAFTGKIEKIIEGDDRFALQVVNEDGITLIFWIDDNVYFADMSDIDNPNSLSGRNITAYYHYLTPVAMSEPGQLTPYAVIVNDKDSKLSHKVDFFDGNGLSSDGGLVISLTNETKVVDYLGEAVEEADVLNNALLIYYDIVAESYPAQTAPKKVVVLKDRRDIAAENLISALDEEYMIEKDGVSYVALRHVAETLGYIVEWDSSTSSAILKMEDANVSFTLTLGSTEYGFNKSIHSLDNAPFAQDGRTFVDMSFVKSLVI